MKLWLTSFNENTKIYGKLFFAPGEVLYKQHYLHRCQKKNRSPELFQINGGSILKTLKMTEESTFFQKNKAAWNERTHLHLASEFYDMPAFLAGKNALQSIELELLGDVQDKSILHLQCHFGQDTLSLARMGAHVTGVDLSDRAIAEAEKLAEELALPARFICCNLYDLPDHLDEQFDVVFTSYGTIGWLPDLDRWAAVVQRFLKPGGRFVFVEFHPVVWMFDDDFSQVKYRYFNSGPIIETVEGTYADREAPVNLESIGWNHDLGEVLGSLLAQKLEIVHFQEYDYSPYHSFSHMEKIGENQYRIKHLGDKIPLVYSLLVRKKG